MDALRGDEAGSSWRPRPRVVALACLTLVVVGTALMFDGGGIGISPAAKTYADDLNVDEEEAVVFVMRTLGLNDLRDPVGDLYEFAAIEPFEGGWLVYLRSFSCFLEGFREGCEANEWFGDDHFQSDSALAVAAQDGRWVVTDVFGSFPAGARTEEVTAFSLARDEEPAHWEFPGARIFVTESKRGMEHHYFVRSAALWVGPIPHDASGSVCTPVALDASGTVIHRSDAWFEVAPTQEWQRASGLHTFGIGSFEGKANSVEMECEPYAGEGWQPASEPTFADASNPGSVVVEVDLIWDETGITQAESRCAAVVTNEEGEEIARRTEEVIAEFWPPGKARKNPPFRTSLRFPLAVPISMTVEELDAEVTCST